MLDKFPCYAARRRGPGGPRPRGPAATASSRDAFVLISGGGSPLTNQFSQYLQARAIAADFQRRAAPGRAWVIFGAGNRTGEAPVFGDVQQQIKRGGLLIDHWVPGPLQDNRPAKREAILRALREEVLPVVRDGGTLYLFIGDHGTESRGENPESIITLWQMERSATGGWSSCRRPIRRADCIPSPTYSRHKIGCAGSRLNQHLTPANPTAQGKRLTCRRNF